MTSAALPAFQTSTSFSVRLPLTRSQHHDPSLVAPGQVEEAAHGGVRRTFVPDQDERPLDAGWIESRWRGWISDRRTDEEKEKETATEHGASHTSR